MIKFQNPSESAAQKLENTRKILEQKKKELDFLFFLEQLLSEESSIPEIFNAILKKTTQIMNADAITIALKSEEEGHLTVYCDSSEMQEKINNYKLSLSTGIIGTVVSTGQPIISNDAAKDQRHNQEIAKKLAFSVENILCVPVLNGSKILGAIELLNNTKRDFDYNDEDIKILTIISAHVGRVITLVNEKNERKKAENMAAIGSMLSGIIHDFKTPMNILSGLFYLTVSEDIEAERLRNYEEAKKQIQYITAMMQETLDYARGKATLLIRKICIREFVKEIQDIILKKYQGFDNLDFEIDCRYKDYFKFDENKMKRVFINLIRNGIQAMPNGGTFKLMIDKENNFLVARFIDTGVGIPPEIQHNLFTNFATFGKKDGIGLGLAIVKNIIEQHNGSVDFESEVNKGTTFRIKLPFEDG